MSELFNRVLTGSPAAMLPSDSDCLSELIRTHRLDANLADFDEYQEQQRLQALRNNHGLGPALTFTMERYAAQKANRLPFLRSSNIMDDVITGRINQIRFSDYISQDDIEEPLSTPHVAVEKQMGIHF